MRCFFDTNILVSMFDEDSPRKKALAQELFEREITAGRAVLSTQVLQEFYVSVTRKLPVPLPEDMALAVVRHLARLPVTQIDIPLILAAINRGRSLHLSFWDALIVEAALDSGAASLFSEDLQSGRQIDGLRIENPFL